jgi:transaldolase
LLAQLSASTAPVQRMLSVQAARQQRLQDERWDEAGFRFALNADAMASEKLAEGIRAFVADTHKLEQLLLAA